MQPGFPNKNLIQQTYRFKSEKILIKINKITFFTFSSIVTFW